MEKKIIFIMLAAVLFIGGCNMENKSEKKATMPPTLSNVSVRTAYGPTEKFSTSGKYAFVTFASDDRDTEVGKIDQRIQTALSKELKKKGFKAGEYSDVSYFVAYNLLIQHEVDVLISKSKTEGKEWISAVVVPNDYVTGALLVQIIDAKSMEPVWLGAFNADLELKSVSEKEKQERAEYAVHELLKNFPPK